MRAPVPILSSLLLIVLAFAVCLFAPSRTARADPPGETSVRAEGADSKTCTAIDSSARASRRFFVVRRTGNRTTLEQLEPAVWPEIGGPPPPGDPFHARLTVAVEPFGPFVLVDGPTVRVAVRPADLPGYYLLGLQEAGGNVTWVQGEESLSNLQLTGGP